MVGMVSGGLAGSVEASESSGGPEGVPGDPRPLGQWTWWFVGARGSWSRGVRQYLNV